MKKVFATLFALIVVAALPAAAPAKRPDTHVQLLAINDLHGHLAPNTPGSIQVGCCNPVRNDARAQTGWTQKTVPAGGIAYLATHIKSMRRRHPHSFTVGRRRHDRREPARHERARADHVAGPNRERVGMSCAST